MGLRRVDQDLDLAVAQVGIEHRRAGRVGIAVHTDRLGLRRAVDQGQGLGRTAPIVDSGTLMVRNDERRPCGARRGKRFLERLGNAVIFAANMGGINPAVGGDGFGKRGKLQQIRGLGRRIVDAGTQASRPRAQGIGEQVLHGAALIGRGRAVEVAYTYFAQRGVTDQGGNIDRRPRRIYGLGIGGEAGIGKGLAVAQEVERLLDLARETQRRDRKPAIADDDRGHALADLGGHVRHSDAGIVVVGVRIDKARRHGLAVEVDDLGCAQSPQVAYRRDHAALQGDVGDDRRVTAAVEDEAAAQENIGGRWRHGLGTLQKNVLRAATTR